MYLNIPGLFSAAVMSQYRQSNILHQLLKFLIPRHKICLTVHLKRKTYILGQSHCIILSTKLHITLRYLNHDSSIVTHKETNQPFLGFSTFQFTRFAPALFFGLFMQPAFCLQTSNFANHKSLILAKSRLVHAHPYFIHI